MTTENNKKESEVLKRFPNEPDFQYGLREKKYAYALTCDCERCKEIVAEYAATPPSIEGEQESELNAIVDKNVKLFKNLRVIELAKELGHETINEKCFICGQSYNIPIDEYLSYKEKQFPASHTSIEGEIKSKEEIIAELIKKNGFVSHWSIYHTIEAMEAYASQFTASKEKEYREALEKIEVEFCFMFPYGQQKGGGAYNLSSPIIIPQEKLPLIKKAIEDILNK